MSIQANALKHVTAILNGLNAHYLIRLADGTEINTIPMKGRHAGSGSRKAKWIVEGYNSGEMTEYVSEQLAGVEIGDVKTIPPKGLLSGGRLAKGMHSVSRRTWGEGAITTEQQEDGSVTFMRIK